MGSIKGEFSTAVTGRSKLSLKGREHTHTDVRNLCFAASSDPRWSDVDLGQPQGSGQDCDLGGGTE
jgi:hypothetical protein